MTHTGLSSRVSVTFYSTVLGGSLLFEYVYIISKEAAKAEAEQDLECFRSAAAIFPRNRTRAIQAMRAEQKRLMACAQQAREEAAQSFAHPGMSTRLLLHSSQMPPP